MLFGVLYSAGHRSRGALACKPMMVAPRPHKLRLMLRMRVVSSFLMGISWLFHRTFRAVLRNTMYHIEMDKVCSPSHSSICSMG
jgi:hypothetical protein